jgi:hypothetical protein
MIFIVPWKIAQVTACLVHPHALGEGCLRWVGHLMPIAVFSRPGYCSRCQQWLAKSLKSTNRAQAEAARRLGIFRSDLGYKIAKYGIGSPDQK